MNKFQVTVYFNGEQIEEFTITTKQTKDAIYDQELTQAQSEISVEVEQIHE